MIEKINKIGKVGRIISKIGRVFLIVAMVACVVVGIIFCAIPKEKATIHFTASNQAVLHVEGNFSDKIANLIDLDKMESIIHLGNQTYQLVDEENLNPTVVERVLHIHNLKWAVAIGAIICAVYYAVLYFLGKICQALEVCETPFTEDVSKALEYLAYAMIAMVVVNSYGASLINVIVTSVWDITIQIDLAVILLILCIFLLVQIFKYGTMLQIEADETL